VATRTEQPILIGNVAGAWSAGPRRRDEPGPLLRFTAGAVVVMFVISMLVLSTVLYLYATIPLPTLPPLTQTTILTDRSGRPITELHAAVDRTVIPFDQMPMGLRRAVIAVEDKHFYSHGGVDPLAIARAAWVDFHDTSFEQGGSTITQQYVKTVLTGSDPTIGRKVREAIISIKLERELSKDQILARYLNAVYFGQGAYGVQAAARTYFGRDAQNLTLLQSATLAGLISAPSRFDPVRHRRAARLRRNYVLEQMVQVGYLSPGRAHRLSARPVRVIHPKPFHSVAAYFADYTRRYLEARYGDDRVFGGGLRVRTTLDLSWQRAAEDAVSAYLPGRRGPAAALVAIDPRDGAIRAMVGGRNFNVVKFNLATQAHRQAGSAFKLFTLAAALEDGISPFSVWHGPPSIDIPNRRCYTNGRPWHVSNYADEAAGTMTLEQATVHSVNTIFAQVVTRVGPENVARMAHLLGIRSRLQPYCSITLGSEDVTPLDMAAAYATVADGGVYHRATPVSTVRAPDGMVIDRPLDTAGRPVLWQNDAAMITSILQHVITSGTGTAAAIGRPAAGKTGTAQDYTNAWFCGYVPQLATCVWVGYPRANIPLRNIDGYPAVYGGSVPALIWHRFMSTVTAGLPVRGFPQPFLGEWVLPSSSPTASSSPSPSPSPSPTATTDTPTPTLSRPPSKTPSPTGPPSPVQPAPSVKSAPSPGPGTPSG
jgi:penicillin-binding protein 1A